MSRFLILVSLPEQKHFFFLREIFGVLRVGLRLCVLLSLLKEKRKKTVYKTYKKRVEDTYKHNIVIYTYKNKRDILYVNIGDDRLL